MYRYLYKKYNIPAPGPAGPAIYPPIQRNYGPYIYVNVETGEGLASWDKPALGKDVLYNGQDIGVLSDAVIFDLK